MTIWANLNYATFSVNFGRKLGYFLFQHLVTVEFDMIQSSAPYAFGHPVYRSKLSQEDWNIRKLLHSVRLWEATVRNSRLVSTYLYSQYLGNAKILGSSFTPEVNVVRNLDSPLTEAAIIKQLTVLKYTFAFHILCRFRHQNKLFHFLYIGEI